MHAQGYPLLLARFTEREISTRFAGSALGFLWALLGPLMLLAIYSFVFGQLFQQRLGDLGTESYTLFVATALWPWMMFSDAVLRAMQSIQANSSLVKKVAFPHLLLVLAAINSIFLVHLAGYVVVLAVLALAGAQIHLVGIPVVFIAIATLYFFALAVGSILAALQTLLRDIEQAVAPAIMMLHYLTPVLYPITLIPPAYRHWLSWNPLATVMQRLRDGLILGGGPQLGDLWMLFASMMTAMLGIAFFMRLSPYFEDFL
ncbi:MAG: ABC transporter permease [Betaproteobacteria bacterium]|nr:ABC transporter permease [Betaproteobacteria bacterium]